MHPEPNYTFASDNTAAICPEAWVAMEEVNRAGFVPSYGADPVTERACALFREFFETPCEVYFVFNGTAANSLALAHLCQSYHSVIVHQCSHVETDECGAPEFFSNGSKLLTLGGEGAKLDPHDVAAAITKRTDIHFPRPRVLSLTLPTEFGTVYSVEELGELTAAARFHGLKVHLDGARFLHALVGSGLSPAELTWKAGIDVLCFGGTKAGIGASEAVVFFDPEHAHEFDFRCKQAGQLASKMRYQAAPWIPMLRDRAYEKYSRHALDLAQRLARGLEEIPGVQILFPVQANGVFAALPPEVNHRLQAAGWRYYHFIGGGARFMCSWQTPVEAVDKLLADARG
jgi:threonine aldolase